MKVIIDTNFLLLPAQFKIDIYSEIKKIVPGKTELIILEGVLKELNKIIKKEKGRKKQEARLSKEILRKKIKEKEVRVLARKGKQGLVDDQIVEMVKNQGKGKKKTEEKKMGKKENKKETKKGKVKKEEEKKRNKKEEVIVATNDQGLKQRLKGKAALIVMRQKKYLLLKKK